SRASARGRVDLRGADARHGCRALLLDVFLADTVGRLYVRLLHRRPLQRRPAQLSAGRRLAGRGADRPGSVLGAAEPRAVRRQGGHRARRAGVAPVHGDRDGLRRRVYRHPVDDCRARILAARLQMTHSTQLSEPRSGRALNARSPQALLATIVLGALLLSAAAELQAVRESAFPPKEEADAALYVQSGTTLRRLSGAYSALAADLYWIRAIQYYGGLARALQEQALRESFVPPPPPALAAVDDAFPLLYAMLDIVTTLDPRFTIAYRFGAVFLAEAYPRGAGRPDLAVKLLEKGLAQRPDKWE